MASTVTDGPPTAAAVVNLIYAPPFAAPDDRAPRVPEKRPVNPGRAETSTSIVASGSRPIPVPRIPTWDFVGAAAGRYLSRARLRGALPRTMDGRGPHAGPLAETLRNSPYGAGCGRHASILRLSFPPLGFPDFAKAGSARKRRSCGSPRVSVALPHSLLGVASCRGPGRGPKGERLGRQEGLRHRRPVA